jgi:hypothetical protein
MTKEHIALHKRLRFAVPSTTPSLKTYAIVDSARDESLKDKVMLSGLNYVDLWHEDLWELELERPLYLVELKKDNTFTDDILSQHHNSIATYLISPYALEALSMYYRKFTWVNLEEEQGKYEEAIFGFYDPNVLPDYVNSLHNKEKIAEFFMGTAMWLMPDIKKEEILYLAFRDKEGKVEDVSIDLKPLEHEPFPSLDFERVSLPNTPELEVYAHEISIEYAQLQRMEEMDRKKYILRVIEEADNQKLIGTHQKEIAVKKADRLFDEANEIGVESEIGVYHYIAVSFAINRSIKETTLYEKLLKKESTEEKEDLLEQSMDDILRYKRSNSGV